MKVLQIIDGLGTGGAERLMVEIIPLMNKTGIEIDVLLLNGEKTNFYKELENTKSCNIFSLGNSFYNPSYIFKIVPFLKRYDLVHVHLFPAQYFAVLAKIISFSNVPFVFTEHNTVNRRIQNPKVRFVEKFIYRYYKKIICITSEVKDVLSLSLNLSEERCVVIENGINLEKINKSLPFDKSNLGLSDEDVLLIMVAGFREQKDQDTVIHSLKDLPENYKLLLVGDGERKSVIEQLVVKEGLQNRVILLGQRADVFSLLKMSDIAVLSSHWEGFGLAAVEGMACGIPTIASNVAGLAQVVSGGGILFEKGDENDLRNKILELENQIYYDSIRENCLKRANEFDISKMIDKLIITYKDVCKR